MVVGPILLLSTKAIGAPTAAVGMIMKMEKIIGVKDALVNPAIPSNAQITKWEHNLLTSVQPVMVCFMDRPVKNSIQ